MQFLTMILLILLSNLWILVASDGYSCAGRQDIYPPTNISNPYIFPENWNENTEPPVFDTYQKCVWWIMVPKGMYATAIFYKNATLYGSYLGFWKRDNFYLQNNDVAPFIFADTVTVTLDPNGNQGRFAFKIVWNYYPSEICQENKQLDTVQMSPYYGSPDCLITYTSPNSVTLVAFARNSEPSTDLRLSAVFAGNSTNGSYIGNLYEANEYNIQSNYNQISVYTFGMKTQTNDVLFLAMDSAAAGNITYFNGVVCSNYLTDTCYLQASSYYQPRAAIMASPDSVWLGMPTKFGDNTTISIYEGQISDEHLLVSLNSANYRNYLPMPVKNNVKIFRVDQGEVQIPILSNPGYPVFTDGHRYIFRSFYYKTPRNSGQDLYGRIGQSWWPTVEFNIDVAYFDSSRSSYLQISVTDLNSTTVFSQRYNSTYLPPSDTFKVIGNVIRVDYSPSGETLGAEVDVLTRIPEVSTTTTTKPITTTQTTTQSVITTETVKPTTTTTITVDTTTVIPITETTSVKHEATTTKNDSSSKLKIFISSIIFVFMLFY